ncbi:MAG: hypothetical protein H6621_12965 [Halobacteriovoraceae bacterium]|nr:hypothetical protein [Halobacteriovoraceae bacterium]MCB9095973.1 hypothetical protein [Halobacteriovoraceae bacterium]
MFTLQQKILSRYQATFPNHTLRQVSDRTGINVSRVFRIFNGYEMKLVEYEKFEIAIIKKLTTQNKRSDFIQTTLECLSQLNEKLINELQSEMKFRLEMRTSFSSSNQTDNDSIALPEGA